MKRAAVVLAATLFSAAASAACYTVLGPKGEVLSQSPNPPVDMSYQLHQTVPYRYGPGATMVFGIADPNCGEAVDKYYDLKPTEVVYRSGRDRRARGLRAPRRDRE